MSNVLGKLFDSNLAQFKFWFSDSILTRWRLVVGGCCVAGLPPAGARIPSQSSIVAAACSLLSWHLLAVLRLLWPMFVLLPHCRPAVPPSGGFKVLLIFSLVCSTVLVFSIMLNWLLISLFANLHSLEQPIYFIELLSNFLFCFIIICIF